QRHLMRSTDGTHHRQCTVTKRLLSTSNNHISVCSNSTTRWPIDNLGGSMARIITAALLQTDWTGDKESMIVKHEQAAREAAAQGAQVICFQELFYGPYFCQVQDTEYYDYTEYIPDGPTTKRFQALAKE